jgi:hypothetical protein
MQRKLFTFGLLFLGLAAVSLFLIYKGRPKEASEPLLLSSGPEKISKVVILEPSRSVTLEKINEAWYVTQPTKDIADPEMVGELLGSLTSFTVGTVISENKEKYSSFELTPEQATHVTVFESGKEKPVLDAYVGKQAVSYGTSYFRYAEKDPVYIAENLPNWVLIKPADEYRQRVFLPAKKEQIKKIDIDFGSQSVSFSQTGSTWTQTSDGQILDSTVIGGLVDKALALRIAHFPAVEAGQKFGFEKPYMKFSVESASGTLQAVIGDKKVAKKGEPDLGMRYARLEGREALLALPIAPIDELATALKGLPATYRK